MRSTSTLRPIIVSKVDRLLTVAPSRTPDADPAALTSTATIPAAVTVAHWAPGFLMVSVTLWYVSVPMPGVRRVTSVPSATRDSDSSTTTTVSACCPDVTIVATAVPMAPAVGVGRSRMVMVCGADGCTPRCTQLFVALRAYTPLYEPMAAMHSASGSTVETDGMFTDALRSVSDNPANTPIVPTFAYAVTIPPLTPVDPPLQVKLEVASTSAST